MRRASLRWPRWTLGLLALGLAGCPACIDFDKGHDYACDPRVDDAAESAGRRQCTQGWRCTPTGRCAEAKEGAMPAPVPAAPVLVRMAPRGVPAPVESFALSPALPAQSGTGDAFAAAVVGPQMAVGYEVQPNTGSFIDVRRVEQPFTGGRPESTALVWPYLALVSERNVEPVSFGGAPLSQSPFLGFQPPVLHLRVGALRADGRFPLAVLRGNAVEVFVRKVPMDVPATASVLVPGGREAVDLDLPDGGLAMVLATDDALHVVVPECGADGGCVVTRTLVELTGRVTAYRAGLPLHARGGLVVVALEGQDGGTLALLDPLDAGLDTALGCDDGPPTPCPAEELSLLEARLVREGGQLLLERHCAFPDGDGALVFRQPAAALCQPPQEAMELPPGTRLQHALSPLGGFLSPNGTPVMGESVTSLRPFGLTAPPAALSRVYAPNGDWLLLARRGALLFSWSEEQGFKLQSDEQDPEKLLACSVQGDPELVVTAGGELVNTRSGELLAAGDALPDPDNTSARVLDFGTPDGGRVRAVLIASDEDLLGAEGLQPGSFIPLTRRARPAPGFAITSWAVAPADEGGLAGYLIAGGRLFRLSASGARVVRTEEVPLGNLAADFTWYDGVALRVLLSTGAVLALPSATLSAAPAGGPDRESVQSLASLCGTAYALLDNGLLRLEGGGPGGAGRWQPVAVPDVPVPASPNRPPFAGGRLVAHEWPGEARLYLFDADGRSWWLDVPGGCPPGR